MGKWERNWTPTFTDEDAINMIDSFFNDMFGGNKKEPKNNDSLYDSILKSNEEMKNKSDEDNYLKEIKSKDIINDMLPMDGYIYNNEIDDFISVKVVDINRYSKNKSVVCVDKNDNTYFAESIYINDVRNPKDREKFKNINWFGLNHKFVFDDKQDGYAIGVTPDGKVVYSVTNFNEKRNPNCVYVKLI